MTEKSLVEQIQDTTKFIETLSSEQSDLSVKMSLAAADADSASLISLRHRASDIPVELLATEIRLQRLLLRRDEERLPQLQTEAKKLAEPIEPMLKKIAEMQREFNIKSGEVGSITEDIREIKMEIAERKRAIESLLRSARNVQTIPASANTHGR
jgi:chromosome segregation ATPase